MVRGLALGRPPFAPAPVGRIALVAETMGDLREVMVEGVSGLLAVHPAAERPRWGSHRGAVAQGFSAEDPESLRGPQFEAAWLDELAKWRRAEAVFDMLQFGLRLGAQPRQMVTTTPRPSALLRRLAGRPVHRLEPRHHGAERLSPRARFPRHGAGPLWRHAARAAGTGGRNHRGPARRALDPFGP